MPGKRLFMTGGTGFFGKSLFRHCADLAHIDIVLLLHERDELVVGELPFLNGRRVEVVRGDVRDFDFPDVDCDYIYHGAATSSRIVPDEEMRSVVVEGTRRVLEFAKRNRRLSKLLFVSSGAVYGNRHGAPRKEEGSCAPESTYGRSKLEAEYLCRSSGLPCCIARGFAFVGEYLPIDAHFAIGNFIRDVLQNKPICIHGDGTPIRSYLYAADLALWLWTILFRGTSTRVYNVGSDQSVSIIELAQEVVAALRPESQIEVLQKAVPGAPIHRYLPDTRRSLEELGLKQRIDLQEAILRTARWYGYPGRSA